MKIQVTQNDIESGVRGCDHSCPIALALTRRTKVRWHVDERFMWPSGKAGTYETPEAASAFIAYFDTDRAVKPFTFDLDYEP